MIDRDSARLLAAISIIAVAAGALLVAAGRGEASLRRDARGAAFERLVGGLGLGADLDLSQCPACFDARASQACGRIGPLPEGKAYCPRHTGSVFVFDVDNGGLSDDQDAKIP